MDKNNAEVVQGRGRYPTHLNFRTSEAGAQWVAEQQEKHHVDVSEILRCALAVAARHQKAFDDKVEARKL